MNSQVSSPTLAAQDATVRTVTLGHAGAGASVGAALRRRTPMDWLWAALMVGGGAWIWQHYGAVMDGYERGILLGTVPSLLLLGWF